MRGACKGPAAMNRDGVIVAEKSQGSAVAKMTTVLFGCLEVELYLTTFINSNYFR